MVYATRKNAVHGEEAQFAALNGRGMGSEERGRLLKTNKKISSVFGTTPPSAFLQMTDAESRATFPSNALRSEKHVEDASEELSEGTCLSTEYLEGSNMAECAASLASACVPPLNLRRRQHRKSQSMAVLTFQHPEHQHVFTPPPQDRPGPSRSGGLVRSQSHGSSTRGATLSRPRPLPPLPRPAVEPLSRVSNESATTFSHNSTPRRLPTPPLKTTVAEKLDFPCFEDSHRSNPWPSDVPEDVSPYHLSISTFTSNITASEIVFSQEPSSSRSSSTSDIPATRIPLPERPAVVKPPIPPRPTRAHASPYKFVKNSYSTTSLSSQISVPPVPPATEIRKRHRNKMAKLMRVLGDSPPPHMVFGPVQDHHLKGVTVQKAEPIYEESDMGHSTMSHESISKSEESYFQSSREKEMGGTGGKGKLNPVAHIIEFGSRNRSKTPVTPRQTNRLRSRPKKDNVSPARRAVSMHVDAPAPSKLSLMVMGKLGSVDVTGDIDVADIEVPGLPTRERVPSRQWLLEIGRNRREVQDYDNVVKSLRML